MPLSTLTSKGQITIPIGIRKSLSIDAGDKIEFIINEQNEVVITKVSGFISPSNKGIKH